MPDEQQTVTATGGQASGQSSSSQASQSSQTASAAPAAASAQTTQSPAGIAPPPPARPDYIPEPHWDAEKGSPRDTFGQYVRDNAARVAADESRRLTRPQKPEDYKFGLSPTFKPPQGLEFKLNETDPIVAQYRQFALESGLDQTQFTKGLDMVAALRVGEAQTFETAKTAELAKLGATAGDRIKAVTDWMTAMAGDKAAGMVNVLQMAPRADAVEALETVMQKFVSQGAPAFSANGRTNTDANGKIPGYENMSFEQRRFAQDQQRARNTAAR